MPQFDRILIADWSASTTPSPARPSADAIWLGGIDANGETSRYFRTRQAAEAAICAEITAALAQNHRLLIGFDFPMAYPQGFAARLTGTADPRAVWRYLAAHITDGADNRNNRFAVAHAINAQFGTAGPFWGCPPAHATGALTTTKPATYAALNLSQRRHVETLVPRAQPVWKLFTTGAAGSQGLMGQTMLHRLCQRPQVGVWPFDALQQITLAEVYPSLLAKSVAADPAPIKDEAQVRLLAKALFTLSAQGKLAPLFDVPQIAAEEGWILGAGHVPALTAALPPAPP